MHVVCEVGFWGDTKIKAFARKVRNPDAGAWILRLREYVLLKGTDDGALPDHSQDEIYEIMGPTCSPNLLFAALKQFKQLRLKRKTWVIPYWKTSPMGKYCEDRQWDRDRKKKEREARHEAALEQINGGTSGGRPVDVLDHSGGRSTVSKKGPPADAPPGPPLKGGREVALTRWEWFKDLHWRLKNPQKCARILGELTDEEWEHLQYALPKQAVIYMSRSARWRPWSDKYLDQRMFLEIPKVKAAKSPTKAEAKKAAKKAAEEDPKVFAHRYLVELLADPHATDKKKQQAKDHWEKTYGDRPWEKGGK